MKKVKQLILNAIKAKDRNLFLRKELSSIEPCHNVIESEKEHRENIEEWKDAFADLYIQMTEDIGCEDVSVEIDTENIIGFGARINVKFKM